MVSETKQLTRDDIVGRIVRMVWEVECGPFDEWFSCRTIIQLDNGIHFETGVADRFDQLPIPMIERSEVNSLCIDNNVATPDVQGCIGRRIDEVVVSELWPPSLGLLFEGELLLRDCVWLADKMVRTGVTTLRAELESEVNEILTYWGHLVMRPQF